MTTGDNDPATGPEYVRISTGTMFDLILRSIFLIVPTNPDGREIVRANR